MKQKVLLFLLASLIVTGVSAQKKTKKITAFAITAMEKGQTHWSEVRLVDITTGEEIETIYASSQKPELLNARTGKPITKKAATTDLTTANYRIADGSALTSYQHEYRVTKVVDGTTVTIVK